MEGGKEIKKCKIEATENGSSQNKSHLSGYSMDYEDNEARDQNLHLVGENSSKVSSVLHSYTLPKFDFDDSLQGHIRFDSLVENEVFLGITSQEDNQWIEEYSCGTSAVESTCKNVWSEATSSESVAMLLKSVGQEEKVLEPGSLTNVMDSNFEDNIDVSKTSPECEQSQETQISGVDVDSVVIADKCKSPVGEKLIDKICDDVSQEIGEKANQSSIYKLQEDPSVTKVEGGNVGSSQNIDASVEECPNSPQELVNNSSVIENVTDHIIESKENSVEKLSVDSEVESLAVEDTNTESKIPDSHVQSHSVEEAETGEGSDINNVGKTSITAECTTEISAEDISHKDEAPENSAPIVQTGDPNDETQSLEPDADTMDQDITLNKRVDPILPSDCRDMDLDVDATSDSQKNVEPSLSVEGCGGVVAMAQGSEFNLTVPIDAVAAVESSKISSPVPANGAQLPLETAVTADDVTEDQPISPILGVRLLHDVNEEKEQTPEVDTTVDSALDDLLPVVEKDKVSDDAEKVVHKLAGHCDPPVGNLDVCPSGQTEEENPGGSSAKGSTNTEEEVQLGPRESMSGEDGAEPPKLAVNMSDAQTASVDVAVVTGPSELDTGLVVVQTGGGSPLDKPQMFPLADSKSIELFQVAKDKLEITPVPKFSNEGIGLQSVSSSSATKEEKSFTFEVSERAAGQTVVQNISFSKNVNVSPVIPSGSQLDPVNFHEDSLVSPQTPSSAATEAGPKEKSERKPRKKPVGRETAKRGSQSKETTPAKRSRKVEKSPPLLTPPTTGHVTQLSNEIVERSNTPIHTSHLLDLNNSTHLFTDTQQVQLRAQILVYGSLLSGNAPEEAHMITAFGHSDGRRAWEPAWHAYLERVRGSRSQLNNPGSSTPDQGTTSGSSNILAGAPSPIVSPMIPISSPLWNISTPSDSSQSNAMPRNAHFDYRQTLSPLHLYPSPQVQNFGGHNPPWLSRGPSPGPWVASSPVPRFSALPITESVKLTTVKESGAPRIPVIPVGPSTGPSDSTGQPLSDAKSRKRKKVATTEGYNQISFLAQNQTKSGTAAVTQAVLLTPVSTTNTKSNYGNLPSAFKSGDQNISKIETREEIAGKIDESKLQAADASVHAAAAVNHCQDVWKQLEKQKNLGLVSDDEAKLTSSAVSIAAASSVAKVAAAAAKIASNVAEQARIMADEVLQSSRTESNDQSSMISRDKATSVISAARDAARRRIEAASSASKHAENLDAILKAAELAAEAVLQAGKIIAMGNPLSLRVLVDAGPEGYWKTLESSNPIVETTPNNKEIQTLKHSMSLQEDSGDLAKNKMIIGGILGSVVSNDNVIPELEFGSVHTSDVDQNMRQSTSGAWKDNIIKEGCLVEVCKESDKKKGAWFAANVLALKDGKAFVCYTEIQSNEASGKLKEWVPLEVDGTEAPIIRVAHPMTTLGSEGPKKRGRTALTNYTWGSGDRVDVWVQNCWCEAVVMATNKIDVTSLTVQFLAQGDTSIVRTWHVRPTLIWKDHKWVEWSSLKESRSSEGDTPHQKRQKFGTSVVEGKEKENLSNSVDLVESGRNQESRIPLFNVGKSSRNESKLDTRRTVKSGLKERSGVVFGVPKPGKKQKFMDMSAKYVADVSHKNSTPNHSVKLDSQIMPQAQGSRGSRNNPKSDVKEKQAVEIKPKAFKSRKPPVPSVRSLAPKDKLKPSKTASPDSVSADENLSGHQNQNDFGPSSNTEDAKETSTSKGISQRLNKGKAVRGDRNATRVEVKEKSTTEAEIRRSNRRIQPTSRLLEGLQSSLSLPKTPGASHASQRSHNKLTPKGSSNPS